MKPSLKTVEAFGRHYIRDIVYAANDGIITTFAVVAGVRGAGLAHTIVVVLGFANLAADGLSMAVGNYLGIKSERAAELGDGFDEASETAHAAKHGWVTWAAFVAAGVVPLLPFLGNARMGDGFQASVIVSALALFAVGALRTRITGRRWWSSGLEMLLVGALAGGAAFAAGSLVEFALLGGGG